MPLLPKSRRANPVAKGSHAKVRLVPFDADLFAEHLDREITARGISLRQAALESGVHPGVLSRVRRGDSSPDVKTVALLLDWMGASADRFFAGTTSASGDHAVDFVLRLGDGTEARVEVKAPTDRKPDVAAFRRLVTVALKETLGRARD